MIKMIAFMLCEFYLNFFKEYIDELDTESEKKKG